MQGGHTDRKLGISVTENQQKGQRTGERQKISLGVWTGQNDIKKR